MGTKHQNPSVSVFDDDIAISSMNAETSYAPETNRLQHNIRAIEKY